MADHFEVLIIGVGLSGVSAAYHIQTKCPKRSFAILEARGCIGGTWDLFRYPGVRSDSDMFTLGYSFHPWTGAKAIADGPSILQYVRDAAQKHGIESPIRFNHRVTRVSWSSKEVTLLRSGHAIA
jgi:cation diffusion facilitator CzcD-associated flavoprotein CzcO